MSKTVVYVEVPHYSFSKVDGLSLGKRKRANTIKDELVLHLSGSDVDLETDKSVFGGYRTRSDSGSSSSSYAPTHSETSEIDEGEGLEEILSGSEVVDSRQDTPRSTPRLGSKLILLNGKLVADPENRKRYACLFPGCEKTYTKPARLREHERSHTGERPFKCTSCDKSYLRETHLHAHNRVHQPYTARPFGCDLDGCEKRFWTEQHRKRHIEIKHNPDLPRALKCTYVECSAAFTKHAHLLAHVASVHNASGSTPLDQGIIQIRPYPCEHAGCGKAFKTRQKLTAHVQVHDGTRYRCSHPACTQPTSSTQYFSTWTALQQHTRIAHPPTCPYPSCNGKIFTQQKGLRAHLKIHESREVEEALLKGIEGCHGEDGRPLKRRRGGEIGRDWKCDIEGCEKDFKSKKALNTHINVTHLHRRDFICSYPNCNMDFGYKHLLQRHMAKPHIDNKSKEDESGAEGDDEEPEDGDFMVAPDTSAETSTPSRKRRRGSAAKFSPLDIDTIIGKSYSDRALTRLNEHQGLKCPHPHLPMDFLLDLSPATASASAIPEISCQYVFSRAYDFRRHLRASHGLDVDREMVEGWVKNAKADASHCQANENPGGVSGSTKNM